MNLTKQLIDKLQYTKTTTTISGSPRQVIWDSKIPGLGCRVYPSGKKTFVLNYRVGPRKRLISLGQHGVITLEQARQHARKQLAGLIDGKDPLSERQKARKGTTVKELCTEYLERHAKVHKRSWREDERRIEGTIKPKIGARLVKDIERSDIEKLHRYIGIDAPYEANRMLALLSKIFEYAIQHGAREESLGNPAKRIAKYKEEKRDRWVTPGEAPKLLQAFNVETNIYARAALWLYLFTGARKTEVLSMKWAHLDLKLQEWRLPTTKAGRTHYIPLSPQAISILEGLPRQRGNPYVICGNKRGTHLVNIDKAWRRAKSVAGMDDLRLHDLRRTVGSWLAQSGESLHLIGRVLNHTNVSTTAIYARFGQDHVRRALDDHGRQILEAASSTD